MNCRRQNSRRVSSRERAIALRCVALRYVFVLSTHVRVIRFAHNNIHLYSLLFLSFSLSLGIQVVLLGDTNTGKTSLVLRFVEGYYRETGRSATIGAFFLTKRITVQEMTTCKLLLWDTAGEATFARLAKTYYQQAAAAILTYDVSSPQSLHRLRGLLEEVLTNTAGRRMVLAIVACKCDLDLCLHAPGLKEEAQRLAAEHNALHVETSSKTNMGVQSLFEQTAERVWQWHCEAVTGKGLPIPVSVGGVSVSEKAQRGRSPDAVSRSSRRMMTAASGTSGGGSSSSNQQTSLNGSSGSSPLLTGGKQAAGSSSSRTNRQQQAAAAAAIATGNNNKKGTERLQQHGGATDSSDTTANDSTDDVVLEDGRPFGLNNNKHNNNNSFHSSTASPVCEGALLSCTDASDKGCCIC